MLLPIEDIIHTAPKLGSIPGEPLGQSRQGRPLIGYRYGEGPLRLSLIAGCHADEPVGPAMLERLVTWLERNRRLPILRQCQLVIVPHTNPDGEARNRPWTEPLHLQSAPPKDCDLADYLRLQHREQPGEDVEFGFPRNQDDKDARPENRAIAAFLRAHGPFDIHATFHGMAFAAGPWFLIEHSWADRTLTLRQNLRRKVQALGYTLHDIDRGGEKGFHRIDEGFTSRPDSRAMQQHFESLGDTATAALFRPSSMEFVRSLGGDPLTLVSEMPLFLLPEEHFRGPDLIRPQVIQDLQSLLLDGDSQKLRAFAGRAGIRPMPIADQMRLQLEFLAEALTCVQTIGSKRTSGLLT